MKTQFAPFGQLTRPNRDAGKAAVSTGMVRRGAWSVALAGGIINCAEMFEGPRFGQPANYGDGGALPYLKILFKFLESMPADRLESCPDLAAPGWICAPMPGGRYVCYAPEGGRSYSL